MDAMVAFEMVLCLVFKVLYVIITIMPFGRSWGDYNLLQKNGKV